ncbi:RNA polymerase sigma factor [Rudanella paleaurantiibacter]|nr:sigma-70 family RNA polymerase sigma factor [Rudanella paleaurantiibacter]
MPNQPNDRELVDAIRSRTPSRVEWAVRQLYSYKKFVQGFVKADSQGELLGSEFANDVFQEAIVTFLKKVWHTDYEPAEATIGTYLYSICWNLYLKERKRTLNRMARDQEYINRETTEPLQADSLLFEQEQQDISDQILGQLSPADRQLFQWYDFEGKSHQEIGELLQITAQAAKQRYYRAKLELGSLLKKYEVYY